MSLITMSNTEFTRLKVVQDLVSRHITPAHAAVLLKLSTRQVRSLRRRFVELGPAGLVSRHRGKPSNRATPGFLKQQVIDILRTHYSDFGPTFAAEKLKEKHGMAFSPDTIRTWMKAEGLWLDRRKRRQPAHQPRYRRECYGELVQIDGSEHHWFEDRSPPCTLLVYIDDATSRLMQLKFVQSESAFSYFAATTEYIQRHGKPVAFYSDKHRINIVALIDSEIAQLQSARAALAGIVTIKRGPGRPKGATLKRTRKKNWKLTPEGRARIVAAVKARWAAQKKVAK